MTDTPKKQDRQGLTVYFQPWVWSLIERLRKTGLYGNHKGPVIQNLVLHQLRELVGTGELERLERAVQTEKGALYDLIQATAEGEAETPQGETEAD